MSVDFEYLQLSEVNPDIPQIPEGQYNFRVVEAGVKPFTYKKDRPDAGVTAGQEAKYIKLGFVIIDDAEQAGRKVYQSIFPNPSAARGLRLLQDATGVQQTGSLDEWLSELVTERATFSGPLFNSPDRSDESKIRAEVRLTAVKAVE